VPVGRKFTLEARMTFTSNIYICKELKSEDKGTSVAVNPQNIEFLLSKSFGF
jgi:hypothetical protein